MPKDRDFYNRESKNYSKRRYPLVASTYIHFFFKRRLEILLYVLKERFGDKNNLNLLEIGCADGVVLREIGVSMQSSFSSMVGIDTAEEMIDAARHIESTGNVTYFVRGKEPLDTKYRAVIEVGVANYTDFDAELAYAHGVMSLDGYYILSIAGKGSLNERMGRGKGYQNLFSYKEYEGRIRKFFDIEDIKTVGIFVPFLWTVPVLGRLIQPLCESLCSRNPNLFHEKLYILKKKVR